MAPAWRLMVAALLVLLGLAWGTRAAVAKDFPVTTTLDGVDTNLGDDECVSNVVAGGACTLRAAIQQANATAGPDFILLPDGEYVLDIENPSNQDDDQALTGDLDIRSNMVISGTSAAHTIIRMGIDDRVFHLNDEAVARISRVTIRDGVADRPGVVNGGAIRSNGGNLELVEVFVTQNYANQFGGAIESFGTLTIHDSTFTDNTADGVNFARGGAISTAQNSVFRVYNSTFVSNTVASRGGAIDIRNNNNEALLNNVTIAGNQVLETGSAAEGGGLYVGDGGGFVEMANTLIADNIDGDENPNDCDGQPTSLGHNLVESLTGCTLIGGGSGDVTGVDPLLGPLRDNGGQTLTRALLEGSPALAAGNPAALESSPAACRATDQRGEPRNAPCDIGAYERIRLLYLPYLDN